MNVLPAVRQGVRFPLGLGTVEGEVVDVFPPDHVVVRVPVRDSAGAAIDWDTIRVKVDALAELPPWKVTGAERGQPTPGADAAAAFHVAAKRNGDSTTSEVRVSATAAAVDPRTLPPESILALQTEGRSAVEKFAMRYRLPRVVVIGTQGVFELIE